MNNKLDRKILNYIDALEKSNRELVKTLKYCVELLSQFKSLASDPQGWQDMLDVFQATIQVAERTVEAKTIQ